MSSIQITRKSYAAHTGAVSQFLSKNETYLRNFRIVYLNFHAKDAFFIGKIQILEIKQRKILSKKVANFRGKLGYFKMINFS